MIKIQYSRYINKRTNQTGVVPTIGPSNDHTDGTWTETDIYPGEMFINMEDQKVYFGYQSGTTSGVVSIYPPEGPSGSQDFNLTASGGITAAGSSPNYTLSANIPGITGTINLLSYATYNITLFAGQSSFNSAFASDYSQWYKMFLTATDQVTGDVVIYESGIISTETATGTLTNVSSYYKTNNGVWSSINMDVYFDIVSGNLALSYDITGTLNNNVVIYGRKQSYRILN